jgi:hypothetical protein
MVFAILIGALVGCAGVAAFILSQRSILLTSKADATDVDSSFEAAGTSISNIDRSLWGSQFQGYNCTDERWNHQTRMYQNTFLCSTSNSYVWGVSKKGNLVWKDLSTGEKKVYYRNVNNQKSIYFWLTLDGKFQMIGDNGEILWQKNPGNYNDIGYHQCLANYACPYLHLHPDGVIVLNWIDATSGSWITKNINKLYGV